VSGDQQPDGRPARHLTSVDAGRPQVTRSGDRVVVIEGECAGETGRVIGIHLVRDDGIRREAAVLLDAAEGAGVRLRRFTEGQLSILD
jgi:hypothetical protein